MSDFEDVTYLERAIVFPDQGTLVVSDVHIGREATSDVELPMGEADDHVSRLDSLLAETDATNVVVAGDFLHSFGSVPYGVHESVNRFVATVEDAGATLTVVAGNHDKILSEFAEIDTKPSLAIHSGTVIHHGHELPERDADRYLIGHEHPAITIEGQKRPCFLYGEGCYRGADLLMLPAFSRVAAGVSVNGMRAADFQSPLVRDADALRPVVWDESAEEALSFPPLGQFRRML